MPKKTVEDDLKGVSALMKVIPGADKDKSKRKDKTGFRRK